MYFTVTAEGKPLRQRRYFYSEAFYAMANAEYYGITGEKEFLELLELTHCKYFGLHPANVVPMMGMLPEHKERLMDRLIKAEQEIPAEAMDSVPLRFGEGGIAY